LFDRARPTASPEAPGPLPAVRLGGAGVRLLEVLGDGRPRFATELAGASGLLADEIERGLGELVAAGRATSDAFAGLRGLLGSSRAAKGTGLGRARSRPSARTRSGPGPGSRRGSLDSGLGVGLARAGRWWCLDPGADPTTSGDEAALEAYASLLLRRYGVVVRRLLLRESSPPPWRELVRVFRRLEDRGEIRGGRFVSGRSGEQFALPDAVAALRETRRRPTEGDVVIVAATDPLNLVGILTPGPRVPAVLGARVALRDGKPLSAWSGGKWLRFGDGSEALDGRVLRRPLSPSLAVHYG